MSPDFTFFPLLKEKMQQNIGDEGWAVLPPSEEI
jgi:hypothetical protein